MIDERRTQFDYLLNALQHASQSDKPAEHGYAEKRRALFAYVRGLEARQSALSAPTVAPTGPVAWEYRTWRDGQGGEPVGWGAWERVLPKGLQSMDDAVQEMIGYIRRGHRYELRSLYAAPHGVTGLDQPPRSGPAHKAGAGDGGEATEQVYRPVPAPAGLVVLPEAQRLLADLDHRARYWRQPGIGDFAPKDLAVDFAEELERAANALRAYGVPGTSNNQPEQPR